jgi:hypothetical protein
MTVRPLQPFDDPGMGFVNMIMRHQNEYPPGGIWQEPDCRLSSA